MSSVRFLEQDYSHEVKVVTNVLNFYKGKSIEFSLKENILKAKKVKN